MKYEYKTHAAYRGYGWIEPLTDSEDSLIEDYLARRICEELNTLQAEVEALRAEVDEWKAVALGIDQARGKGEKENSND